MRCTNCGRIKHHTRLYGYQCRASHCESNHNSLGDANDTFTDDFWKDCEELVEDRGDDPTFCPDCGYYTLAQHEVHSNIEDESGYHSMIELTQCTNDSCDYEDIISQKMIHRNGNEYEVED